MKWLKRLLIGDLDEQISQLQEQVNLLTKAVLQCNQLSILQLNAMGLDVRFLTPEEADAIVEKLRASNAKGAN